MVASSVLLAACMKPAQESMHVGPFEVETLFTKDGCTVYRFMDAGYPRYFVRCGAEGRDSTAWSQPCGKACMRPDSITTAKD